MANALTAQFARRQLALIPSGAEGKVSIIRLSTTPEVVATVKTATGARTIGLDPSTGRAYLPAADQLLAAGNGHGAHVAGSFRIIVIAPRS